MVGRVGSLFFDLETSSVGHANDGPAGVPALHAITATSEVCCVRWRREECMNESPFGKPAPASRAKAFDLQIAVRYLWTASMAMMMLLLPFPAPVLAGPHCPGIHVQVLNIRNSKGTVACALFDSPHGFPTEYLLSATNIMVIKVRKLQARCDFEDIPPGKYALAVIHDENMNGKLDVNVLGIHKEGYGFSNDPKSGPRAPSFSDASFSYNGENLEMTISLHY